MFGSSLKILRVDLTNQTVKIEHLSEETYRTYPGGKALAGYLLLNELPSGVDPLSPQNMLVIAVGLLTGAPVSTTPRFVVSAKSPLSLGFGQSEAGGFWGPEFKLAGFEALVITGRANQPIYLFIKDGEAKILPAEHLWGKMTAEVEQLIRQEQGDDKIRVLQTGIAGENLVRYAGLTNDLRHFNGRNGMGAVFGSKNLRAIAVRGNGRYQQIAANAPGLMEIGKGLARRVKEDPISWELQSHGTLGLVSPFQAAGMLPTRNFQEGLFEGWEKINWDAYEEKIFTRNHSCYACAVRCKREVKVDGKESVYGGPEYETVGSFGSNCGVGDIEIVAKANELCNAFMLDTVSCGMTISFAMECYEKGLLTKEDTDGLDLRFGNAEAMLVLIEKIAHREGFGNLLAEGSWRVARQIGRGAEDFSISCKRQELPMHEPRGKFNVGMGYAISEIGADHLVIPHDGGFVNDQTYQFKEAVKLGMENPQPAKTLNADKMKHFYLLEQWVSLENTVGYCFFGPSPRSFIQVEEVMGSINNSTGWNLNVEEALLIGERATNMARLFNLREGFTRADDTMPKRLFSALPDGPLSDTVISYEVFQESLSELYRLKGWDPQTGVPTRGKLESLSLGWVLEKEWFKSV